MRYMHLYPNVTHSDGWQRSGDQPWMAEPAEKRIIVLFDLSQPPAEPASSDGPGAQITVKFPVEIVLSTSQPDGPDRAESVREGAQLEKLSNVGWHSS